MGLSLENQNVESGFNKMTLRFYPKRKCVGWFAMAFLIMGIIGALLASHHHSVLMAICSGVAFVISVFLFGPVIRRQVVDVGDNSITVCTFGRPFELKASHLVEVVSRKGGPKSYRFQAGNRHYQVTPQAYYQSKVLQQHFNRLFE